MPLPSRLLSHGHGFLFLLRAALKRAARHKAPMPEGKTVAGKGQGMLSIENKSKERKTQP